MVKEPGPHLNVIQTNRLVRHVRVRATTRDKRLRSLRESLVPVLIANKLPADPLVRLAAEVELELQAALLLSVHRTNAGAVVPTKNKTAAAIDTSHIRAVMS